MRNAILSLSIVAMIFVPTLGFAQNGDIPGTLDGLSNIRGSALADFWTAAQNSTPANQSQTLQTMSNVSKAAHDAAMQSIRNFR